MGRHVAHRVRHERARWAKLVWFGAGMLLSATVLVGVAAARYVLVDHPRIENSALVERLALENQRVAPSWILDGHPSFRGVVYAHSPDDRTFSGVWECVGPTRLRWHYDLDETVYILDGAADVEHEGKLQLLRPGSVAFFPAGSTAVWSVPNHVKKAFASSNIGRIRRLLRKTFLSYPPRVVEPKGPTPFGGVRSARND
jgi:uncharacterized cupin superfamily protein